MARELIATAALAWLIAAPAPAAAGSPPAPQRLVGVYKGVVLNNVDPQQEDRLQVSVPALPGFASGRWAEPSAHPAALPLVGAQVSIEFQGGDANYPVWVVETPPPRASERGPWAPATP
jgi:hypothetical protein